MSDARDLGLNHYIMLTPNYSTASSYLSCFCAMLRKFCLCHCKKTLRLFVIPVCYATTYISPKTLFHYSFS